jgi:hypothetical protein
MYKIQLNYDNDNDGIYTQEIERVEDKYLAIGRLNQMIVRWFAKLCPYIEEKSLNMHKGFLFNIEHNIDFIQKCQIKGIDLLFDLDFDSRHKDFLFKQTLTFLFMIENHIYLCNKLQKDIYEFTIKITKY